MDSRILNYFLTVADEGNISRASKMLHLSQPTLSRQLMKLEEELGVSLFKRNNHNVELTPEGVMFKRRAHEILMIEKKAISELNTSDEIVGEVTIGCSELKSVKILSKILEAFYHKYPKVKFTIISDNSDDIKYNIEAGIADVGLVLVPLDVSKYEYVYLNFEEERGLFIHKDMDMSKKTTIKPKDLVGKSIMLESGKSGRNEIIKWLGEYAEDVNIVANFNLPYNSFILSNYTKAMIMGLKLDWEMKDLVFVPLEPKLMCFSALIWKGNQIHSPAVTAFIEFAKEYLSIEHI